MILFLLQFAINPRVISQNFQLEYRRDRRRLQIQRVIRSIVVDWRRGGAAFVYYSRTVSGARWRPSSRAWWVQVEVETSFRVVVLDRSLGVRVWSGI